MARGRVRSPGLDGSMAKLDGGLDGGLDGEPRWLDGEPRWLDGEKLCDHVPSASSLDGSMARWLDGDLDGSMAASRARWRPRGLDGGLEGLMAGLCESNSIHKACHMCVLCSNSDNKCWVIKGTYPARISDVVHRNPLGTPGTWTGGIHPLIGGTGLYPTAPPPDPLYPPFWACASCL